MGSSFAGALLDAAVAYLEFASDEVLPTRLRVNRQYFQLTSAYQALHTLEKHAPDRLDSASIDWGGLIRAVFEFHLEYTNEAEDKAVRSRILGRMKRHATQRLEKEIRKLFERSVKRRTRHFIIDELGDFLPDSAASLIVRTLRASDSADYPSLLHLLYEADPCAATEWCADRIRRSADVKELATVFPAVVNYSPDEGFKALYAFAESKPDLAKEVLLAIAHDSREERLLLSSIDERVLLQLYEWLLDHFPRSEEKFPMGMHAIGAREDLADWRDSLLSRVIKSGSRDALQGVTELVHRRPELQLEWALAALRESSRLNGWSPITVRELRELQERQGTRLIRSHDGLLQVLVEELTSIQGWLSGETPQAFSLWNVTPTTKVPKDENTISDWYCHALRLRLIDRGIIVNREVEVQRRSLHGVGLRQDLRVEVVDSQLDEHYVCVVEVKGVWNSGVRTNLETQLAADYLAGGGLTHGVYLVVSFDSAQVTDKSKSATIVRNLSGDLHSFLENQARSFAPALTIRPIVHDASLPQS
jgi:hypothetical protein